MALLRAGQASIRRDAPHLGCALRGSQDNVDDPEESSQDEDASKRAKTAEASSAKKKKRAQKYGEDLEDANPMLLVQKLKEVCHCTMEGVLAEPNPPSPYEFHTVGMERLSKCGHVLQLLFRTVVVL